MDEWSKGKESERPLQSDQKEEKKYIEHRLEGVEDWRLALARDKEEKSHKGKPRNGEGEKGKKQAKEFDWLA